MSYTEAGDWFEKTTLRVYDDSKIASTPNETLQCHKKFHRQCINMGIYTQHLLCRPNCVDNCLDVEQYTSINTTQYKINNKSRLRCS